MLVDEEVIEKSKPIANSDQHGMSVSLASTVRSSLPIRALVTWRRFITSTPVDCFLLTLTSSSGGGRTGGSRNYSSGW